MFNLFLPKKTIDTKIDDNIMLKLAENILEINNNSCNLSKNLLDDLEIFEGNKIDKNKTLFQMINNTQTIFGKVYLNEPNNVFLDIGDKVQDRVADGYNSETGLIGLAFHPTENYFLVSFGDPENTLNFVKKLR